MGHVGVFRALDAQLRAVGKLLEFCNLFLSTAFFFSVGLEILRFYERFIQNMGDDGNTCLGFLTDLVVFIEAVTCYSAEMV